MSTQISTTLDYFRARWVEQSVEALKKVLSDDICYVEEDGRLITRESVSNFLIMDDATNSYRGYDTCDITDFHVLQKPDRRLQIAYTMESKKKGKVAHTTVKKEELSFDSQNLIQNILIE